MKLIRIVLLSALTGALAALFVQRPAAPKPTLPRKHRTLNELSPTYDKSQARAENIYQYDRRQLGSYANAVTREMIRPDLTEVEAERVALYFKGLIGLMSQYETFRKDREQDASVAPDERIEEWLRDVENRMKDKDDEA